MLHCGGERSISYQVSQLLVNLLDLYAGRVAYPIDEPESVEAKTTVDEVSGRDGSNVNIRSDLGDSAIPSWVGAEGVVRVAKIGYKVDIAAISPRDFSYIGRSLQTFWI